MPFVDSAEADILDAIFDLFGDSGSLWVGLSSTTPDPDGTNITEPSGGGYARVEVTTDDFAAAVAGDPAEKKNDETIDFGTASGDWAGGANLTYWVIFDAAINGNAVLFGELTNPQPVMNGNPVSFPAGNLVLRLGAPADFGS